MIRTLNFCEQTILNKIRKLRDDGKLQEGGRYPSLEQLIEIEFQTLRTTIYDKGCTCFTGPHMYEKDIHCVIHDENE